MRSIAVGCLFWGACALLSCPWFAEFYWRYQDLVINTPPGGQMFVHYRSEPFGPLFGLAIGAVFVSWRLRLARAGSSPDRWGLIVALAVLLSVTLANVYGRLILGLRPGWTIVIGDYGAEQAGPVAWGACAIGAAILLGICLNAPIADASPVSRGPSGAGPGTTS